MSIYAMSDLHGCLLFYQKMKEQLQPEDKVICLGDCGDRGPQGWETIKAVLEDPQFTYLRGNHEDMLIGAMQEYLGEDRHTAHSYSKVGATALLVYNGGIQTLNGWKDEGADSKWLNKLLALPFRYTYDNKDGKHIILSHAGPTSILYSEQEDLFTRDAICWDRDSINLEWPDEDEFKDTYMVHGHTPCWYLSKSWKPEDGPIYYQDGHKIDIDCGTVQTHAAYLFDLDNFDGGFLFTA